MHNFARDVSQFEFFVVLEQDVKVIFHILVAEAVDGSEMLLYLANSLSNANKYSSGNVFLEKLGGSQMVGVCVRFTILISLEMIYQDCKALTELDGL